MTTIVRSCAPTRPIRVTSALQEFIARRPQRKVAGLRGKLEWDDSFGYRHELTMLSTDDGFELAARLCPLLVWAPKPINQPR